MYQNMKYSIANGTNEVKTSHTLEIKNKHLSQKRINIKINYSLFYSMLWITLKNTLNKYLRINFKKIKVTFKKEYLDNKIYSKKVKKNKK